MPVEVTCGQSQPGRFDTAMSATETRTATATTPATEAKARRPPGRPRGALGRVLASSRKLGVHHFAFLCAGLVGMDAADAFARYLYWGETSSDPSHVRHRRAETLKLVL